MKITRHFRHLAAWAAVLTVGLAVTGCASSGGKSTTRVYEEREFIPLYHVKNTGDELNLKKGDAIAMACAKCKTVLYRPVRTSAWLYRPWVSPGVAGYYSNQRERLPFQWHSCPGCKSTITITGTWLNQKETVKHTCELSGVDSVFCCATRREAPPTEGMLSK